MKIQDPENSNYAAVVISLKNIVALEGSDNIVGTPLIGYQAIVSKDHQVGDIGIVFPAETQLSLEYCQKNNLFRHSNLNQDESKTGYIEDNRRVKAMKFRGNRSDCLFMPLSSLAYTKVDTSELKEGDIFDTLKNHDICRKFTVKRKGTPRMEKNKLKKFVRVESKFMPEHYDTDNYFRNMDVIKPHRTVTVTQKLHGTSVRIGHTIVLRKLNFMEQLLTKAGVKIQTHEYAHVGGSRKVIKDPDSTTQNDFYDSDIWTAEAMKLKGILPENYLIYGELIGFTPEGAEIQKGYSYDVPAMTCDLYVYRIAVINNSGLVVDLVWSQVKELCRDWGLKAVPELWTGLMADFKPEDWIDKRLHDEGYANALQLSQKSTKKQPIVDEGICIRVDGLAPYTLKCKSPIFLGYETKMLDEEALDLESEGSTV